MLPLAKEQAVYINGVLAFHLEGEIPDTPKIYNIIKRLDSVRRPQLRRRWSYRFITTVLPGIVLIVLPKCMICGMTYIGVISMLGIGHGLERPWLSPVMSIILIGTVISMAYGARGRNGYGPVALALVSSLLMISGKFTGSNVSLYIGGATLLVASLWNANPFSKKIGI